MYNGLETMQNDIDVIVRVRAGDTEAFRSIVERYERPLLSVVQHLARNAADAEDVAQEVFLTAFEKLDSFDPARSHFSTWLFTIARNKTINANKKKRAQPLSALPERHSRENCTDRAEYEELFDHLDAGLNALPAKQRRAFVLAQMEELPYEEIARIEGTRVGTIKSRVNRARKKLQASWASGLGDHDE